MTRRKQTASTVEKIKSWGNIESTNALKYQAMRDMKRQGI